MHHILFLTCALLFAGCASPQNEPANAASTNVTSASAGSGATLPVQANVSGDPLVVPFAFDGSMPVYVNPCALTPLLDVCLSQPMTSDFSKMRTTPSFGGKPLSGKVTATWKSAAPNNEKLVLAAFSFDDRGGFKSYGFAYATSPAELTMKSIAIPSGQTFYVGLFAPNNGAYPGPIGAGISVNAAEQPFHLEGSFLVEPK